MRRIVIALMLLATPAGAYDDAEARAEEREALLQALKAAPDERVAKAAADALWEHWFVAPDETAQRLLAKAMARRMAYDYAGAIEHLDELVAYAPDYAEGWNQRATVLFLQGRYDASLEDVEKVLALEPAHFGALSGKGMILMSQGRAKLAQDAMREAVAVHPYLSERRLLSDGAR